VTTQLHLVVVIIITSVADMTLLQVVATGRIISVFLRDVLPERSTVTVQKEATRSSET
jgi:hypothetical protein